MVATAPPSHNPYTASLRYAVCMRAHGVPQPDPGRTGDFRLTPEQERLLRSVSLSRRLGKPVVENRPRGRASFGFENAPPPSKAQAHAQRVCEQRVDLAEKLGEIIAEDRSGL